MIRYLYLALEQKLLAIVVSLKLEGDEMKLKTWYVLRDSDKRRGLLIKRKQ